MLYYFFWNIYSDTTLYQVLSSIYVIDMTLTQTLMKIYCTTLQLKFINKSFMTKKMQSFYSALLLIKLGVKRQRKQCVYRLNWLVSKSVAGKPMFSYVICSGRFRRNPNRNPASRLNHNIYYCQLRYCSQSDCIICI